MKVVQLYAERLFSLLYQHYIQIILTASGAFQNIKKVKVGNKA